MSADQAVPASFGAVARVTEDVCALPAVATLDWGDRAAASLTPIAEMSRACVLILSATPAGEVNGHEATGVAVAGRSSQSEEQSEDLALRSRAERLSHLGFAVSDSAAAAGLYGTLESLVGTPEWRTRGLGELWASIPAGEVLVAACRLGNVESGRLLIAMLATNGADAATRAERLAVLRVTMPLVVRRALLAIGTRRSTSARWLTAREQQVLEELTLGKSVRQIAEEIGRSQHTIHDHVKSLHRKLNASSRGELVARALGHIHEGGAVEREAEVQTTRAASMVEPTGPATAGDPSVVISYDAFKRQAADQ